MRVIAGQYRSRPLRSLRGLEIRPTADRLRETLFNVLTAGNPDALAGSVWMDLYAGTGAVGIEALSRGAGMVYFVESSRAAVEVVAANLKSLGIGSGFRLDQSDVKKALGQFEKQGVVADFVFFDPPYQMRDDYCKTLEGLARSKLLRESGVVIAEHEKKFDPGPGSETLLRYRKLEQGDAALSFYQVHPRAARPL